jgi:hypothetical protein
MINRAHELLITRQMEVLNIRRGSVRLHLDRASRYRLGARRFDAAIERHAATGSEACLRMAMTSASVLGPIMRAQQRRCH